MSKSTKMSRSDILLAGLDAGLPYDEASDLQFTLSPECQLVSSSRVDKAIAARVKAVGPERCR